MKKPFLSVGTRSVLYGAHQFLIHPMFVAAAWWRLYGFPWDLRLWVAFAVHDLGYIGKPNMDGPEGEAHPYLGARIMLLFGRQWHDFTLCHSRFMARRLGRSVSRLCLADKLATVLIPAWLYLPLANLTGEIHEYMAIAGHKEGSKYAGEAVEPGIRAQLETGNQLDWFRAMTGYLAGWVEQQRETVW